MRLFRHSWWQHLDYRVKVATTQENKPPTQGTRQWTFTTPRWRCGSILLPSLNAGVPEPTGGVRHGVAVAAYFQLASRSQVKNFTTKNFFDQFCHQCTATPAPSQGLPPRFLTRFSSSRLLSNIFSTGTVGEFLATATPCLAWRYRLLTR